MLLLYFILFYLWSVTKFSTPTRMAPHGVLLRPEKNRYSGHQHAKNKKDVVTRDSWI